VVTSSDPTVFVVDDDDALLDSLATMADTVGMASETFSSARAFLDKYEVDRPGCLVLDIRMPDMNGLELQDVLKARGIDLPVVIISGHADVPLAVRALKSGAIDVLEKPFRQQVLLDCIRDAFQLDSDRRERRERTRLYAERFSTLTPREREVMQLLVQGNQGKTIASALNISYKTMEKFRAKVMKKMQAGTVVELVLMAVDLGLVDRGNTAEGSESP